MSRQPIMAKVQVFILLTQIGLAVPALASDKELNDVKNHIHEKNAHWVAAKTEVSELTDGERKSHMGALPLQEGGLTAPISYSTSLPPGPAAMDWRNFNGGNYVTPVKNQGSCGSCWAFATTAALESQIAINQLTPTDLNEQIVLSCSGAGSCGGGYASSATAFLVNTGSPDESYYRYTATNGSCANAVSGWQYATRKIVNYTNIARSVSSIESALSAYGPMVIRMDIYSDFYYYAGGIYKHTSGTFQGNHYVTLIGYDHANQYFVAKNSWGTGWGEAGFFRIGYSELSGGSNLGTEIIAYSSVAPTTTNTSTTTTTTTTTTNTKGHRK